MSNMSNEFIANLSLSAQEQILIRDEILQGKYGRPGDVFMTTRALSELRNVSVVTAHQILVGLCEAGYIELRGKRYYLSYEEILEEKMNQTRTLGIMIPQLNNEFYSSLSNAVVRTAAEKGYRVFLMSTNYSPDEEREAIRALINAGVAGIINCVPTPPENEDLYRSCPVPCVLLGHSLDKSKISSVQVNSFSISQKVAQNLIEEGYTQFFYIGTNILSLENDIRFTAFQMELKQHGYTLDENNIFRISADKKNISPALVQRLQELDEPAGFFCYHDLLAVQIYRICRKIGKTIPNDIGVIGFDDLSIANALHPTLTTVQYRITTMADMAVNLLLARISSPSAPYDNYYIEPNLVIRKSAALSETRGIHTLCYIGNTGRNHHAV